MNENYAAIQDSLVFSDHDLLQMAKNSFLSAFLDPSEIEGYLAELDEYGRAAAAPPPINIV